MEIVVAATEVEGVETWTTTMVIDVEEVTMVTKTVNITGTEAVEVPAGTMIMTVEVSREDITISMTMALEEYMAMVTEDLCRRPMVDITQDHHPPLHTECLLSHLRRLLPQ